jgi:hypothetical protein
MRLQVPPLQKAFTGRTRISTGDIFGDPQSAEFLAASSSFDSIPSFRGLPEVSRSFKVTRLVADILFLMRSW